MNKEEVIEVLGTWPKRYKIIAISAIIISGGILGGGFFGLTFIPGAFDLAGAVVIRIFSLAILAVCAGAVIETRNRFEKWLKILSSVVQNPREIVWVYREVSSAAAPIVGLSVLSFNKIHIYLKDGTTELFTLKEKEAENIFSYFKDNYPDLSVGWNVQNEKTFKENPLKLKEAPVRNDLVRDNKVTAPLIPV